MARRRRLQTAVAEAAVMLLALFLAGVAGVAGYAVGHATSHTRTVTLSASGTTPVPSTPIDPHVAAGAHDFSSFACAQCHGDRGRGGVSPDVPALSTIARSLTPAQLRHIINHGLGESKNPTKPYMPVWGVVISTQQVSDLIAYLRAGLPPVPTAEPPAIPQGQGLAVEGATLYANYGCINCHGPNGLGGVPNPQAPDKKIPALSGVAFRKQFNTDAKIIAVIRSGSVIGRAPIVSMPHWGGIIPAQQLQALVAYLKTLK
jgi:mono/diheme cytochrome c family protein